LTPPPTSFEGFTVAYSGESFERDALRPVSDGDGVGCES
jgi:hypothetical protein